MDFATSTRAAEVKTRWKEIVVKKINQKAMIRNSYNHIPYPTPKTKTERIEKRPRKTRSVD